jgi:hypothetical protein
MSRLMRAISRRTSSCRLFCQTVQRTRPPEVGIVCEEASGVISNDIPMPLVLILNELGCEDTAHSFRFQRPELREVCE